MPIWSDLWHQSGSGCKSGAGIQHKVFRQDQGSRGTMRCIEYCSPRTQNISRPQSLSWKMKKHLLIENRLPLRWSTAKKMVKLAEKNNIVLGSAMWKDIIRYLSILRNPTPGQDSSRLTGLHLFHHRDLDSIPAERKSVYPWSYDTRSWHHPSARRRACGKSWCRRYADTVQGRGYRTCQDTIQEWMRCKCHGKPDKPGI